MAVPLTIHIPNMQGTYSLRPCWYKRFSTSGSSWLRPAAGSFLFGISCAKSRLAVLKTGRPLCTHAHTENLKTCRFIKEGLLLATLILCGLSHKDSLLPELGSLSGFVEAAPAGVMNAGERLAFHCPLGLLISALNTRFAFNVLGFFPYEASTWAPAADPHSRTLC